MRPIVIAAHPLETEPLRQALPDLEVFHFGVGAINAAQRITDLLPNLKGRDCIYLGSAGVLGDFKHPSLYLCNSVRWLDYGLRANASYVISGDLPPISICSPESKTRFGQLSMADVVCSATISTTDEGLNKTKDSQALLENVELYSVAGPVVQACASFAALLGTTNGIGANAHELWLANAQKVAEMSKNLLLEVGI